MVEHGVQHESWGPFAEGRNNLFTHEGASQFFDHRDPTKTAALGSARVG